MSTIAKFPASVPASPAMKAIVKIPHIVWRAGRPRFQPGPGLRKLGMVGRDLKHPTGQWFTLADCEKEAELIAIEARAARQAKAAGHKAPPAGAARGERYISVGNLVAEYFTRPELNGLEVVEGKKHRKPLSGKTVAWYKKLSKAVEQDAPVFWQAYAAAVDAMTLDGVIDTIEKKRGLATARGCRALLSTVWGKVGKKHRLTQAIFGDMEELPTLGARTRAGTPLEMLTLIRAADEIGMPQIGDSVMIGLATSQRQNDRLALERLKVEGQRLRFKQSKTGAPIDCPLWPALLVRIEAAFARRKAHKVHWQHLVIDEQRWRPYSEEGTDYRHAFAEVREVACNGIPDIDATIAAGELVWIVEPCPSLANFHDQDLRDTSATWAYSALKEDHGPDLAKSKLKGLTGHKSKDNNAVLDRHYLDIQAENADQTVMAMASWLTAQGVKL